MLFLDLLEEDWRNKLDAIWHRYRTTRDPEAKLEYVRLLRQFSDLVLRGKRPTDDN